jgi:malate dehydrogenase (oxaloacetate-decarboxylating)(NADP+)
VFRSGLLMKPLFDRAKADPKRIVFADGEDERVLRAVQAAVDEGLAKPILVGRRETIRKRIELLGLRMRLDHEVALRNPEDLPHYQRDWMFYHQLMGRRGVSPDDARTIVRTRNPVIAALMVAQGDADGMICGAIGRYHRTVIDAIEVLGLQQGVEMPAAMSAMVLPQGTIFLCDTHVLHDPDARQIARMTLWAAEVMPRFGVVPRAALLSHSNFGSRDTPSARKMREALAMIRAQAPDLEVDGEMTAEVALSQDLRNRFLPDSPLKGDANLLIMPTLDAANIALNLLREMGQGQRVGPILLGMAKPAHVLDPSTTVRGIVNMIAICVVDAQAAGAKAAGS